MKQQKHGHIYGSTNIEDKKSEDVDQREEMEPRDIYISAVDFRIAEDATMIFRGRKA